MTPELHVSKGLRVSTVMNEADVIRREMAMIRLDMHKDVRGVVATAEKVADWSRYIGNYPWISLGVAFGVGYWIVPRKKAGMAVANLVARAEDSPLKNGARSVSPAITISPEKTREAKSGLLGAAFGMLAPLAVRAAQGYALKYLEQWIAQQSFLQPVSPPDPSVSRHPGAPGGGTPPRGTVF